MRRNLFTIAPGAPFLKTFVDAFLAGEIVPSVARASGPLALARTTIYVPTRRAARALVAEFSQAFDGGATLLPRVLPLGGIEERENAALFSERQNAGDEALAPPIEELERRLLLSQLILQWSRALERAIISVDPTGAPNLHESEPILVASTPASAYALAKDLGALIDEFIIEDIAPDNIKNLSDEAFDQYWAITTHFLDIALKEWPAILAERGRVDAAMRQKRLIETQIDELKKDGGPPVIALGSTGAQPTTARLLAAIAARENGAVILPGLDQAMSDAAWARIGEGGAADSPAFTHPQTMLKRLLQTMGVDRREPRELARLSDALSARRALVAQAMLPPDETTAWRDYRATAGDQFARALAGVTLVEAPDDRLEALTLALFMREALETPDATVALVTPDKNIARRVTAELRRFEIDIDDSGGKPLAATPLGALARLIARIGVEGLRAVNLAALLAHPLASFGLGRARVASLSPILEAGVLRIVGYSAQDLAATVEAARELSKAPHAHPAARRIDEEQWRAIEDLVVRINAVFASFAALGAHASLRQLAETHRNALEGVIAGAEFAEEEGAGPLFELFQRLAAAEAPPEFDAQSYAAFFDDLGFETILRGPRRAHPRLKILGPLEARLIDAKLILLAGLDEGVWPPQTDTGAFLNRSMRARLGLSPPERRIGQSAHDVMMAFGAPRVILSRALKRNGSPTVASRFISRLAALAGDAMAPCKARGKRMLAIAEALDRPLEVRPVARPEPRPPTALRPKKLSVTRIERLRRDPYAIFAESILRLVPLSPLGAEPGAREIGMALHDSIAEFVLRHPIGALPESARAELRALARARSAMFLGDPVFLLFQWPHLESGLDHALAFEMERRACAKKICVEIGGAWTFPLGDDDVFTLTAVADRIEIDAMGRAHVFDYKTGKPPKMKQVAAGWSPQLTLEAAMIEAGAFSGVGSAIVESAAYIALKRADTQWIDAKDTPFTSLVVKHRAELFKLLNQFRNEATPYASRPYVAFLSGSGDYDHLARVKEWMRGGTD